MPPVERPARVDPLRGSAATARRWSSRTAPAATRWCGGSRCRIRAPAIASSRSITAASAAPLHTGPRAGASFADDLAAVLDDAGIARCASSVSRWAGGRAPIRTRAAAAGGGAGAVGHARRHPHPRRRRRTRRHRLVERRRPARRAGVGSAAPGAGRRHLRPRPDARLPLWTARRPQPGREPRPHRAPRGDDRPGRLAGWTIPTLPIGGTHDGRFAPAALREVADDPLCATFQYEAARRRTLAGFRALERSIASRRLPRGTVRRQTERTIYTVSGIRVIRGRIRLDL